MVATLAEESDFYAERSFVSPWYWDHFLFKDDYHLEVTSLGLLWAKSPDGPPRKVKELWRQLMAAGYHQVGKVGAEDNWKIIAMKLLAIADEASAGVGFSPKASHGSLVSRIVFEAHREFLAGSKPTTLPYIPFSLCWDIPPEVACVQPKTNTPGVGCTLRSLSHHLALLPPVSKVRTSWKFVHSAAENADILNLLLLPFPYRIEPSDFTRSCDCAQSKDQFLEIKAGWMRHPNGGLVTAQMLSDFIINLIHAAGSQGVEVHGVVLPEASLPLDVATELADELAANCKRLELLVAGTISQTLGAGPRNQASWFRLNDGQAQPPTRQSKHHRWRLDGYQIERYGLNELSRDAIYWERIEVAQRECYFEVLRKGASLAVLVCEDLARSDPVMPVLNAVGPNLVICLLMDGPQVPERWSGRHSMGLADDPGSAVLTLTSWGMVDRSNDPRYEKQSRSIALWKSADVHTSMAIPLLEGDHAVLLCLKNEQTFQKTLDGRSDGGGSRKFNLVEHKGIRIPNAPSWLNMS